MGIADFVKESQEDPSVKDKEEVGGIGSFIRTRAVEDPADEEGIAGVVPGPADIPVPRPNKGISSFVPLTPPPGQFQQPPVNRPKKGIAQFVSNVDPNVRQALQDEIRTLEEEAAQHGILGSVGRGAMTVLTPIIDIISRPNYAVAGAAEEIFQSDDDNPVKDILIDAPARIAREIFSNPIIKGDKQGFGEVFEDLGMSELGRLSNLAPHLFSESGEGWKFQQGGFFDFTGRGTLGLAGDIILDPLTYVTFGTGKGAQLALKPVVKVGTRGAKEAAEGFLQHGVRELGVTSAVDSVTGTTKIMGRLGSRELESRVKGFLGLSSDGLHQYRGRLFGALQNRNGYLNLSGSRGLRYIREIDPAFGRSPLPSPSLPGGPSLQQRLGSDLSKVPIENLTPDDLRLITGRAVKDAEQDMASDYLGNPADFGHWFDDGGIKFMGRTLPGTPELVERFSQMSADAIHWVNNRLVKAAGENKGRSLARTVLEGARNVGGVYNSVVRLFSPDVAKDPVYLAMKQMLVDKDAMLRGQLAEQLHRSIDDPVRPGLGDVDLNPQQWETIIDVMDETNRTMGREVAKKGLNPEGTRGGLFTSRGRPLDELDYRGMPPGSRDVQALAAGSQNFQLEQIRQYYLRQKVGAITSRLPELDPEKVRKIVSYVDDTMRNLDTTEFALWRDDLRKLGIQEGVLDEVEQETGRYMREVHAEDQARKLDPKPIDGEDVAQEVIRRVESNMGVAVGGLTDVARQSLARYVQQWVNRKYISNIPMYFENRSAQITQALSVLSRANIVRFNEDLIQGRHRGFYSNMSRAKVLKEASKMKQVDPAFPALRPVIDLREMIRRRMDMHVEDLMGREWEEALGHLGIDRLPVHVKQIFRDLKMGDGELTDAQLSNLEQKFIKWVAERNKIDEAITKGAKLFDGNPVNNLPPNWDRVFAGLTDAEKRQWLAWELLDAGPSTRVSQIGKHTLKEKNVFREGASELGAINRRRLYLLMSRYKDHMVDNWDIVPKYRSLKNYRDADYTAFRNLQLKRAVTDNSVEVPTEWFDDFIRMKKNLLQSREVAAILKPFDHLNNAFKTGVTSIFPAFHFRNLYGNVSQAFSDIALGAFDPKQHTLTSMMVLRDALRRGFKLEASGAAFGGLVGAAATDLTDNEEGYVREVLKNMAAGAALGFGLPTASKAFRTEAIRKLDQKLGKMTLTAKNGRVYTINEIEQLAIQHQVMTSGEKLFELVGEFSPYSGPKLGRKSREFQAKLREPATIIENEARIQLFINHLRRGLSPQDAAARVKKFLFDYNALSPFEQQFMRRIIPFYVWFRKNIPLQIENLTKRPGRIAVQLDLLQNSASESEALKLYEDVDGSVLRLDRDGKNVTVLSGVDLPFTQLNYFDALLGNSRRQRELLTMVNPLIRLGPEIMTNTSFFTGKNLDRRESTAVGKLIEELDVPKGVRDWIGYAKDTNPLTGLPRYTFNGKKFYALLESWAVSRMLRTSDRIFEREVLSTDNVDFLNWLLTATRLETINLDERELLQLRIRRNALRKALEERGARRPVPITSVPGGTEF